jgi:UDP-N-acetyl-D-mannosaminuronic acid dehydrogenase
VDPWFIVSENPSDARIIREARHINDSKPDWVISKVSSEIKNLSEKKPIGAILWLLVWGLRSNPISMI